MILWKFVFNIRKEQKETHTHTLLSSDLFEPEQKKTEPKTEYLFVSECDFHSVVVDLHVNINIEEKNCVQIIDKKV